MKNETMRKIALLIVSLLLFAACEKKQSDNKQKVTYDVTQ